MIVSMDMSEAQLKEIAKVTGMPTGTGAQLYDAIARLIVAAKQGGETNA